MTRDQQTVVRTFSTPQEIRDVPGFKEDNPITRQNYKAIIGDYDFPDKVECCFQDDGSAMCRRAHNWGFVAQLQDESVTIIGNICANSKFSAEENLTKDKARYQNAKRLAESQARIESLLSSKEETLARFRALRMSLKALQQRNEALYSELGKQTAKKLQDLARSSTGSVFVLAVKLRTGKDEKGDTYIEHDRIPMSVGTISGLRMFRRDIINLLYSEMNGVVRAFDTAHSLSPDAKVSAIDQVATKISDADRICASAEELLACEALFRAGDLTGLCYLDKNMSERVVAARTMFRIKGKTVGRDAAKDWISSKDAEFLESFNATKLFIG